MLGIWMSLLVVTAFVRAEQQCVPVPSDVISWWPFDETKGTTAVDIIKGYNGTYVSDTKPVESFNRNGLLFDGFDDYVDVGNRVDFSLGIDARFPMTVEFWFNQTAATSKALHFMGKRAGCFGAINYQAVIEYQVPGSGFGFGGHSGGVNTNVRPSINTWHHFAGTFDGKSAKIYLNGQLLRQASATALGPLIGDSLKLGGIGGAFGPHCNGWLGVLDEVTLYKRALTDTEIQAIYTAGPAGKCKTVSVATNSPITVEVHKFFSEQLRAQLGQPPYTWAMVAGILPHGVTLQSGGILSGTPTQIGRFTFRVRVTDALSNHGEKDITVEVLAVLPKPDIRVYKTGTTAVPGREIDYFIVVENVGTVAVQDLEILEFIEPDVFTLTHVDPETIVDVPSQLNVSLALWLINLTPSERKILNYKVRVHPSVRPGTKISGQVYAGKGLLAEFSPCLQKTLPIILSCSKCVLPCSACFKPQIGGFCPPVVPVEIPTCLYCLGDTLCGPCLIAPGPTGQSCITNSRALVTTCFENAATAIGAIFDQSKHEQIVRNSFDPNEKEVIANKYIQSQQRLPYVIHYENIGTADAQDIFITDNMNPEYNLSTVEVFLNNTFFPISDGQSIILFQKNQTKTINQTVGNRTIEINISYFENHTVSLMNNRLRWELLNIRLDVNKTDKVIMAVKPREGLTNGTHIKNKAEIVFDINQPILTNETLNIIDDVRPTCTINVLPIETRNENVTLTWSGTDPVGEIDTYTIFMNENHGPFVPMLNNTKATNATITTKGSEKYGFICLAVDTASNSELQFPTPEAETYVNLATLTIEGTPKRGSATTFHLKDISQPNTFYVLGLSLSRQPGIPLGDGRSIPLTFDLVFEHSLFHNQQIGLINAQSKLNSRGEAVATWNIPNVDILANLTLYASFFTVDLSRPIPGLFTAVADAVPLTIQ